MRNQHHGRTPFPTKPLQKCNDLGLNTDIYSLFRDRSFVAYDTNPQTLDVVQGTRQLRATTQLHWRKEIVTDPGVIITPFGRVRADLLLSNGVPEQEVVTQVLPANQFWPVEEAHQDYYIKNPLRYRYYKYGCGRPARLKQLWGAS